MNHFITFVAIVVAVVNGIEDDTIKPRILPLHESVSFGQLDPGVQNTLNQFRQLEFIGRYESTSYYLDTAAVNYTTAIANCVAFGMSLPTFMNQAEVNFVNNATSRDYCWTGWSLYQRHESFHSGGITLPREVTFSPSVFPVLGLTLSVYSASGKLFPRSATDNLCYYCSV